MDPDEKVKEDIKRAYRMRERFNQLSFEAGEMQRLADMTKDEFMRNSQEAWRAMYNNSSSDEQDAAAAIDEYANRLWERAEDGDIESALSYQSLVLPDTQAQLILMSGWAHYGYRQLVTSHRYAAGLMASKLSRQQVEEILPPWPAFMVEIPSGLLFLTGEDGTPKEVSYGLARRGRYKDQDGKDTYCWSYLMIAKHEYLALWGINVPAVEAYFDKSAKSSDIYDDTPFSGTDAPEMNVRTHMMFWRLVFGLCLAMQEKDNYKVSKAAQKGYNHRQPGPPVIRTYIVGKPPNIDCRKNVIDYVLHGRVGGGPLTVQTLVCGHFRQQPHGPRSSLRKTIWIEPFWRGPEDAPILVRAKAVLP